MYNKFFHRVFGEKLKVLSKQSDSSDISQSNKDDYNLVKSYTTFSYIILILVLLWIVVNTTIFSRMFWASIDKEIKSQGKIVEKTVTSLFSSADNYFNYIGDKIATLKQEEVNDLISIILQKPLDRDLLKRNTLSWMNVNFIDDKSGNEASSEKMRPKNINSSKKCYPLDNSVPNIAWHMKIEKIVSSEIRGDKEIVPVSMKINLRNSY